MAALVDTRTAVAVKAPRVRSDLWQSFLPTITANLVIEALVSWFHKLMIIVDNI
jgi:hypothetical protein